MQELTIIIFILVAAVFIRRKYRETLYHSEKERVITSLAILTFMISWESISIHNNVWFFPGPGMIGIFIFDLPIELFLFYLILPYFVFSIFELIHKKVENN